MKHLRLYAAIALLRGAGFVAGIIAGPNLATVRSERKVRGTTPKLSNPKVFSAETGDLGTTPTGLILLVSLTGLAICFVWIWINGRAMSIALHLVGMGDGPPGSGIGPGGTGGRGSGTGRGGVAAPCKGGSLVSSGFGLGSSLGIRSGSGSLIGLGSRPGTGGISGSGSGLRGSGIARSPFRSVNFDPVGWFLSGPNPY